MIFEAQSGPTHNQQVHLKNNQHYLRFFFFLKAVFSWSGTPVCANIGHAGMPDSFNFGWTKFAAYDY